MSTAVEGQEWQPLLASELVQAWVSGLQLTRRTTGGKSLFPANWENEDVARSIYDFHSTLIRVGGKELGGHVGYKQGGMGVIAGEPCFFGPMFGRGLQVMGSTVSLSRDHVFGIEAEVGFLMNQTLPPPAEGEISESEVWSAIGSVLPCIETCGTRYKFDGVAPATGYEKMCDASCAAGVVMGDAIGTAAITQADLCDISSTIAINGEVVAKGSGRACPEGSPFSSLCYVVRHLHRRGLALEAGALIIAGATAKFKALEVGQEVTCDLGVLGIVTCKLDT